MRMPEDSIRASRNRTIGLSPEEIAAIRERLRRLHGPASLEELENQTVHQDVLQILEWLPHSFVDLLVLDPPYNLTKSFNSGTFRQGSLEEYQRWFESWFPALLRTVKRNGTVYICADWRSSAAVHLVARKYLVVRNRITWEREKGRGAKANWKNCSEDIWFCTVSDDYAFNLDAVKVKRRVLAPYTTPGGQPKDWERTERGKYRLTHPSNLWSDLTVPFWSMPENTNHPTQKPEKLLGKIILASSDPGDMVFDPFLGSGTTSVVAKKLRRRYAGVELDEKYCCLAEKRLALAVPGGDIQGYCDGVFWERNTHQDQGRASRESGTATSLYLFEPGSLKKEGW